MLVRVLDDGSLENMHVSKYPQMSLFHTRLSGSTTDAHANTITVTKRKADGPGPDHEGSALEVPLGPPNLATMPVVDIVMHKSPGAGHDMVGHYSAWFTSHFGFPVKLLCLGPHTRSALMTMPARPADSSTTPLSSTSWTSWLGSATGLSPAPQQSSATSTTPTPPQITFADCAPYLVISRASVDDVSSRLSGGEAMDETKFRANILIGPGSGPGPASGLDSSRADDGGAVAAAYDEDYWAQIRLGEGAVTLDLVHNCARCVSLNVDHATGDFGRGDSGAVLKKLMRDRRVDPGNKWSPIFGRYAFLGRGEEDGGSGRTIRVGDEVAITKRNNGVTIWDWPGLSTLKP